MNAYADLRLRAVTAVFAGSLFWTIFVMLPPVYFSLTLLTILMLILWQEWIQIVEHHDWLWIVTPVYPVLPFMLLIVLNEDASYRVLLYYLFLMVFVHDIGSYLVGNMIGKTKIFPSISPGKSWEGFLGGFALTCSALWFNISKNISHSVAIIMLLAFIVCTIAFLGDLFESWLKRQVGLKNSGTLLPGHGGLLDRFDGVLFAALFFYLFKKQLALLFC